MPDDYDKTFLSLSRRGARVLALGVKTLGSLSPSKAKELSRDSLECDLRFAGFIVISCPLKVDSKAVIKELVHASHHVAMITGDNPLTACHVARELRFTKSKTTLILTEKSTNVWGWESVNEEIWIPIDVSYLQDLFIKVKLEIEEIRPSWKCLALQFRSKNLFTDLKLDYEMKNNFDWFGELDFR